ncbi:MAG: hypothetical protein RL412_1916 [Pseudomonadota bacterium]|jgi:Na+/H+ antiporter NhaA
MLIRSDAGAGLRVFGSLAFTSGEYDIAIGLGVLTGSALSALVGCTWLIFSSKK